MSDLNPSTSSSNDRSLRSSKPKSAKGGAENKPSVVPCDADMIPSTSHQSPVQSDNSNNRREDFESLLLHTNELTKTLQQHFVSKNDDRPSEENTEKEVLNETKTQNILIPEEPKVFADATEEEKSQLLQRLNTLGNAIAAIVNRIPKPEHEEQEVWATLTPKSPKGQSITLKGNTFSVGKSTKCDFVLKDANLPPTLCAFHNLNGIFLVESLDDILRWNDQPVPKGTQKHLQSGDEISFNTTKKHSYMFQIKGVEANTEVISNSSSSKTSSITPLLAPLTPRSRYMTRSRRKREQDQISNPNEVSAANEKKLKLPDPASDQQTQLVETNKKHFKEEFQKLFITPDSIDMSLDRFPYYLSDLTKQILLHSAFMYLMKPDFTKYVSELPLSRKILLSGPPGTELYQETLVMALAKHFNVDLMIVDINNLEIDIIAPTTEPMETETTSVDNIMQNNNNNENAVDHEVKKTENLEEPQEITTEQADKIPKSKPASSLKKLKSKREKAKSPTSIVPVRLFRHSNPTSFSPVNSPKKILISIDDISRKSLGLKYDRSLDPLFPDDAYGLGFIDPPNSESWDSVILESLFEVLVEHGKPCILLLKEPEILFTSGEQIKVLKKELTKLTGSVVVIGSTIADSKKDKPSSNTLLAKSGHSLLSDIAIFEHFNKVEERSKEQKGAKIINKLFGCKIPIIPPSSSKELEEWNSRIASDVEKVKLEKNKKAIKKVLDKNNLECEDLDSAFLSKQILPTDNIEKIVGWAVSNYLMNTPANDIVIKENQKLFISKTALEYALQTLWNLEPEAKNKTLQNVECENEFERKLLSEVIPPSELQLGFQDIGALDDVKQNLRELVMLPLQRPELFTKGSLTKPCKGILLFGPPGTGKTMLAKAIATQCSANFINVSMATIASKWFGEGEKYVKAIFTLASKIAPTVIFIDEVDSILSKREKTGEHEAMRKIKNEFMTHWDGLKTKENERVLVLAATNRPFDLDEAVLRRMSRRLLVDLPNTENRVKILKVILGKEDLESDFDYEQLAKMTEGFSGSDIKNLCVAAAYQPIREILEQERLEEKQKDANETNGESQSQKKQVSLRPLTMKDFDKSLSQISASVSEDASSVAELRKWNEMYGDGGSRKKDPLPYFM